MGVYPADWKDISGYIRFVRAQGRCECTGECGLHLTHPGPRRCLELDGMKALYANGLVVLTVAHLNGPGGPCRCDPLCGLEHHLKAMCNRCHLRYDGPRHRKHQLDNRRADSAIGDLFDRPTKWRPRVVEIAARL